MQVSATAARRNVGVGTTPGDVEWTVLVHNDGATTLPVSLADLVPSGTTYVPDSISGPGADATSAPTLGWLFDLPAGASRMLTFTTTEPSEDTVNTPSNGNSAALNVREQPLPSLVTTTSAQWLWVGDELTVTIAYTNSGPAVTGATLRQFLGEDVTFVTGATSGQSSSEKLTLVNGQGATFVGGTLVWSLGDLASGASGTVTFTAEADTAGPFVIDGASLTSSGPPQLSNTTFGVAVAPCAGDEPCMIDTLVPNVGCVLAEAPAGHIDDGVMCNALGVSIFADEGSVSAGGQVSFAAFFENRAATSVGDATLVVTLPAGTYVPGSSSGSYDPGAHTLTWALGDLPANADGGVAFTLTAVEGTNSLAPSVTLTAPATEGASAAVAPVPVTTGVHISATVDHVYVGAGSTANNQLWSMVVHNEGPATTLTLVNPMPAHAFPIGGFEGPGLDGANIDFGALFSGQPTDLRWVFPIGEGESRTFGFRTQPATADTANQPVGGNATPTFRREVAQPIVTSSIGGSSWREVGQDIVVIISYSNPGPALTGATLRQFLSDLTVVNPAGGTVTGSSVEWSLGDLPTGASGVRYLIVKANTAGPFVIDRLSLTSSGPPQVGNHLFGVAVEPCGTPCTTGYVQPNIGCSVTQVSNVAVAIDASDVNGDDSPIGSNGEVIWSVGFESQCNRGAKNVEVAATVAAGSGFVVGSLDGVPEGFSVEYLDATWTPITPAGNAGDIDLQVARIRVFGNDLPLPGYVATTAALDAGTTATTSFDGSSVGAVDGDGVWRSELITPTDLAGWTRVTLGDRSGDDPTFVSVLDASDNVVPGYSNAGLDANGRLDISEIDATAYPALRFEVTLEAATPVCDLAAGRSVALATEAGNPYGTRVRTSAGAWLGGTRVRNGGATNIATIWAPNGEGPDGWGQIDMPVYDYSTEQAVYGLDHDDPSTAIGVSNGNLVSWTRSFNNWTTHVLGTGYVSAPQGRSTTDAWTDIRPGVRTNNGGYIYYDTNSSTGVRYLDPYAAITGIDQVGSVRMIAMDQGLPMLIVQAVSSGVWADYAVRMESGQMVAERIGDYVTHAAPDSAVVVGAEQVGANSRATRYTRNFGVWYPEYLDQVAARDSQALLVMNDDNVYGAEYQQAFGTWESVFYQKRDGVWQTFPTGLGTATPLTVRNAHNEGYILATVDYDGVSTLVAVRPPRSNETESQRIVIAALVDAGNTLASFSGYLGQGRVLGQRDGGAGMVVWQINADDTVTEIGIATDKRWGDVQNLPPNPSALPVADDSNNAWLWIPGTDPAGQLVAAYPEGYTSIFGQSNIVPSTNDGMLTFEFEAQARAYGCWVESNARFGAFDVSYRSTIAEASTFSFRTELLDGTCADELVAQASVMSNGSSEGTFADNNDEASIPVAVAEVGVSFGTSLSTVRVGETVTFEGSVTNDGPQDATGVVVSFAGPGGPQVVNVGTITAGAAYTFEHDYVAVAADDGTVLSGTLSVATGSIDCTPEDDAAEATAAVAGECADEETACDGIDDDCNGQVDDVVGAGEPCDGDDADACERGTMQCQGNALACVGDVNVVEVCNGLDDDCRNGVDDGMVERPTQNQQGLCAGNTEVCNGVDGYEPAPGNYPSTGETCNGLDDDCDSLVDEGMVDRLADNQLGRCAGNMEECNGVDGYEPVPSSYTAADETCNGLDDDCDNAVDEGMVDRLAVNQLGRCAGNMEECNGVAGYEPTAGSYTAAGETCNGLDDDCDNAVDEGMVDRPAANQQGRCAGNMEECNGAAGYEPVPGSYAAADETCNGLDDDCDIAVDEGMVDQPAANQQGPCAGNMEECNGVAGYEPVAGSYVSTDETCNGIDDDCDGPADEDFPTLGTACDTPGGDECLTGTVQCVEGDAACVKTGPEQVEECNGLDDDCNGIDDDGIDSVTESCTMVGGCAGTVTSSCQGGDMVPDAPCALVEAINDPCDGVDNDCDTEIDEDFEPEPVACGVDACSVDASTSCVDGEEGDTCDEFWSDIPDTICGVDTTGLNVAYIIVTNANGDAIGSVRCFQDLGASNTPVMCDTESNGRTLKVYTELLCQGFEP